MKPTPLSILGILATTTSCAEGVTQIIMNAKGPSTYFTKISSEVAQNVECYYTNFYRDSQ